MTPWPVEITTDGNVSSGAVLFRFQQRLTLTLVVKASFSLLPDGEVTLAAPDEILREDRSFERRPTRSVEAASDLAPYLGRCDVTFTGHAYALGGGGASAARLAVFRDGRPLLDKTIHVFGDREGSSAPRPFPRMPVVYERALGGPGVDGNPVGREIPNLVDPGDPKRPAAFAPISRFWPARKRLLGALDRAALEAPIAALPDAVPWAYFQAAPPDQQIEHLRGGEWLVLDGLHPTLPRLSTRLLEARAEARVRSLGAEAELPVELVADTLAIDGDALRCSIVWRGRYPLAGGEASLPTIRVAVGLSLPGRPIAWDHARATATPWGQAPLRPAPAPVGEATMAVGESQRRDAVGESTLAAPARPDREAPVAPFPLAPPSTTLNTGSPQVTATPWSGELLVPAPALAPGEATFGLAPPAAPPIAAAPPFVPPLQVPPAAAVAPPANAPALPPQPAAVVATPSSAPRKAAPLPPAPRPPAPPPKRPPLSAADPAQLAQRLFEAGAGEGDVASLLSALKPPAPPPPDEDL